MSLKTGFVKIKEHLFDDDGKFILQSLWTSSQTVEFDDGTTAEEKLGSIQGIVNTKEAISSTSKNNYIPTSLAVKEFITNALRSKQDADTAITTSNIGSQTVASANAVAWGNVTGKPSSMPASDVYAWAKANTKPTYSYTEITGTKPTYAYSEITGKPTFSVSGTTLYITF